MENNFLRPPSVSVKPLVEEKPSNQLIRLQTMKDRSLFDELTPLQKRSISPQKNTQLKSEEPGVKGSFIQRTMEEQLIGKFQILYDCFFKIIKNRLGMMAQNHKGQIDELMYAEDSINYLVAPQSKASLKSFQQKRAEWLEDYLYLPSHVTFNQRSEILKKYGAECALVVEKDFKIAAKKLALEYEAEVFSKFPDLEQMVGFLEEYDGVAGNAVDILQAQHNDTNESQFQVSSNTSQMYSTERDAVLSSQREVQKKKESSSSKKTQLKDELTKIKMREVFQQRMLDTATVINNFDQEVIVKLKQQISIREREMETILQMNRARNSKVKDLEDQVRDLKEKCKSYEDMKKQNDTLVAKISAQEFVIAKLKEQKKDMSMNYNKELSANKIQQVAVLKAVNEKYLNPSDMIQVSFFNELSHLEKDVQEMLNQKLEQVREQAHEKIAHLIQENEKKETQILKYKNLAPELYSLAQYSVEEIVNNMPVICDDIDKLWNLLLQVFGEECFTPNIVRKFPAQFTGDVKTQKEQLAKLQQSFDAQIAEFEEKVRDDISQSNVELQSSILNAATLERLYQSVHITNQELKIVLAERNKEFNDFRKSVNSKVFQDMSVQQHVEYESSRLKSRYESIIELYRGRIEELAEENNRAKHEIAVAKMNLNREVKQLKLENDVMEKALHEAEALTKELLKDKDRVMQVCKRDAPKVYRLFQLDIFSELSVYKKKIINTLYTKLIKTSRWLEGRETCDVKVGTKIQDVKTNIVKVFKLDEFGRAINLDMPNQQTIETQTEIVQVVVVPEITVRPPTPAESVQLSAEKSVKSTKQPSIKSYRTYEKPVPITDVQIVAKKVPVKNCAIQCKLLLDAKPVKPAPIRIQAQPTQLTGDYMTNLLNRMNGPDPRDVYYLNKELSTFDPDAVKKLIGGSKYNSGTVQDIPVVYDRLYQHSINQKQRQNRARTSYFQQKEHQVYLRQSKSPDAEKATEPLIISPAVSVKKVQGDPYDIPEFSTSSAAVLQNSTKQQSLVSSTPASPSLQARTSSNLANINIMTGDRQLTMIGLFKNQMRRLKRFSSPPRQHQRKAQSYLQKAWSSKNARGGGGGGGGGNPSKQQPRQKHRVSSNSHEEVVFSRFERFKSVGVSGSMAGELEIIDNNTEDLSQNSSLLRVPKRQLKLESSDPVTLIDQSDENAPAFVYGDTQEDQKEESDYDRQRTQATAEFLAQQPSMRINIVDSQKKQEPSFFESEFRDYVPSNTADSVENRKMCTDLPKPSFLRNPDQDTVNFRALNVKQGRKVFQRPHSKEQSKALMRRPNRPQNLNARTLQVIADYNKVIRQESQGVEAANDPLCNQRCMTSQVFFNLKGFGRKTDVRSRTAMGGSRMINTIGSLESDSSLQHKGVPESFDDDIKKNILGSNKSTQASHLFKHQTPGYTPTLQSSQAVPTNERPSTQQSASYQVNALSHKKTQSKYADGGIGATKKKQSELSSAEQSMKIHATKMLNPDVFVCTQNIPTQVDTSQLLLFNQDKTQMKTGSNQQSRSSNYLPARKRSKQSSGLSSTKNIEPSAFKPAKTETTDRAKRLTYQ